MKEKFLECMQLLYPYGEVSKTQLRDMIRIFSMAWASALEASNSQELYQRWLQEHADIADLNWWPDDTWKWWL